MAKKGGFFLGAVIGEQQQPLPHYYLHQNQVKNYVMIYQIKQMI